MTIPVFTFLHASEHIYSHVTYISSRREAETPQEGATWLMASKY